MGTTVRRGPDQFEASQPRGVTQPMTIGISGVRQANIWPSVVSDDAPRLREWLLALGFREDLLIPGERRGAIHHCQMDWPEGGRVLLSSTDERHTPLSTRRQLATRRHRRSRGGARAGPRPSRESRPSLGGSERLPLARLHGAGSRRELLDLRHLRRLTGPREATCAVLEPCAAIAGHRGGTTRSRRGAAIHSCVGAGGLEPSTSAV